MKHLMELLSIVSILTALGALSWAGLGAISVSPEYGNASMDVASATRTPLLIAGAGFIVFLVVSRLQRKF